MKEPLDYLSLYSGVGCGDLGLQTFLGWNCKGYVEWDKFCCSILEQRIKDGILSDAPVFCGDIRRWFSDGYGKLYKGKVDCITAGFPCQPFSTAGNRNGKDDHRNMWPITAAIIDEIRPNFCLLENVPALVSFEYYTEILQSLAGIGYNIKWDVLSAAPLVDQKDGKRLWILATSTSIGLQRIGGKKFNNNSTTIERTFPRFVGKPTPRIRRGRDGTANYMDRVKAIGNGQVPTMAAIAFESLYNNY